MISPTTTKEPQEQARERALDKQEQLCQLNRALAILASASVRINGQRFFSCSVTKNLSIFKFLTSLSLFRWRLVKKLKKLFV